MLAGGTLARIRQSLEIQPGRVPVELASKTRPFAISSSGCYGSPHVSAAHHQHQRPGFRLSCGSAQDRDSLVHPRMFALLAPLSQTRAFLSEKTQKSDTADYSKTLFLPQTEFPMRAGLPQREPEILKYWNEIDLY